MSIRKYPSGYEKIKKKKDKEERTNWISKMSYIINWKWNVSGTWMQKFN